MIWPWLHRVETMEKPIIEYVYIPNINDISTIITIGYILLGVITVILLEYSSKKMIK